MRPGSPTGATRVAAVIGDPVAHSLSPTLHNAAFAATGLDWTFVALPVASGQGEAAVAAMKAFGIRGLAVTMPHKAAVAAAADRRSPAVTALGAANCLVLETDGTVTAHNTDGEGFIAGLAAQDRAVSARRVAVIGAGGAARAVIEACAGAGARSIAVVNRSTERATAAAALAGPQGSVGGDEEISAADIVVNATPLGMTPEDQLPCEPTLLNSHQLVVDLIYAPRQTAWLSAAAGVGCATHNGLPMLLHQAAAQFRLWTGTAAPLAEMGDAIDEQIIPA